MPRYFISSFGRSGASDEDHVELDDLAALERLMRRSLAATAHHDGAKGHNEFAAYATDADGTPVMTVTLSMLTTKP